MDQVFKYLDNASRMLVVKDLVSGSVGVASRSTSGGAVGTATDRQSIAGPQELLFGTTGSCEVVLFRECRNFA